MAFQPIYAIKDRHGRGTLLPYKQGIDDGSTLTLDFTKEQLDPRLTFTRSGTATFINANGLVATASTDTPRFDYDPTTLSFRGLLIEGPAINYATALDTPWGRQNINGSGAGGALAYGQTGADGASNTAARLTTAATTTFTNMFVTLSTNAAGASRTFSVWLRGVGSNTTASFAILGSNTPSGVASSQIGSPVTLTTSTSGNNLFALVTGLSTTAWTRVSISRTDAQASSDAYRICPGNHTGTINSNLSVDVYVPQVESGIGMSSTIPTGSSQGTRNADFLSITGSAMSWFSSAYTEGTFAFRGSIVNSASGYTRIFALTQSTALNSATGSVPSLSLGVAASLANRPFFNAFVTANNNVDIYAPAGAAVSTGVEFATAIAFKAGDWRISSKNLAATSAFGSVSTTWGVSLFMSGINGVSMPVVWYKQFKFFPTRLPNAQMDQLGA